MKKIFTLLFASVTVAAFSQKVKVNESRENIGGGNNNALTVTIYEVSPDDILKEFKGVMKDYDAKVSTKNGELFGDHGLIKKISNNTIDMYAKVEKVKDGESKLIVAFDLGGAFMNSADHKEQYKVAKEIVENFAIKIQKDAIAEQLAAAQKVLDKMSDQQKDLEKKNQNLNDDIKNWQDKIKKAQDDIKQNEQDQVKKKADIEAQNKVVNAIKEKQKAIE
jgi:chromosome segregation ATPase